MSNRSLAIVGQFEEQLQAQTETIKALLNPGVSVERFKATAVTAVRRSIGTANDLMVADRASVFDAIAKAAEDGMMPDGREGAIVVHNTKVKVDGKETWVKMATWMPMVGGIRKRAKELAGIQIDAQVRYEKDTFRRVQGDEPRIEHEPSDDDDPGPLVGCYAIFKINGEVVHREYMRKAEVHAARNQNKYWNTSMLWTKFEPEAWRKTVIKRGMKSVPAVTPELQRILDRDNHEYTFKDGDEAVNLTPGKQITLVEAKAPPNIPWAFDKGMELVPLTEARTRIREYAITIGDIHDFDDWLKSNEQGRRILHAESKTEALELKRELNGLRNGLIEQHQKKRAEQDVGDDFPGDVPLAKNEAAEGDARLGRRTEDIADVIGAL